MKTINNSEGQGSLPFRNAYPISDYFTTKINLDKELKMNQELGTIYIATNLVNGKQNVGQTTRNLKIRIREHESDGFLLSKSIKKYGIKNFKIISFSCPEEDLDWQETFLIKELKTLAPNGYNLDSGGHKNKHASEITKQKISELNTGKNNPFFGKQHTPESKEKNRMSHLGKKSLNIIGEKNPQARSVILISPEGVEYKLPCYSPFCKEYHLDIASICSVLQGKYKQYKGWTGRYKT